MDAHKVLMIIVVLFFCTILYTALEEKREFQSAISDCENKGGVLVVQYRTQKYMCVKKESIMEMER